MATTICATQSPTFISRGFTASFELEQEVFRVRAAQARRSWLNSFRVGSYFTRNTEEDFPSSLPCESTTKSLYVPALAGAAIVVALAGALVMLAPSANWLVPGGANQMT